MFNNPRRSTVIFCVMLVLMIGFVEFIRPNTDNNQSKSTVAKSNVQNGKAHVLNTFSVEESLKENSFQNANYMYTNIDTSDAKVIKKYDEIKSLNKLFDVSLKNGHGEQRDYNKLNYNRFEVSNHEKENI